MRLRPLNRSNEIARAKHDLDEKYQVTPPAPFLGWHARGYLPHCDKPGLIQFVTFRLDDAMPANGTTSGRLCAKSRMSASDGRSSKPISIAATADAICKPRVWLD